MRVNKLTRLPLAAVCGLAAVAVAAPAAQAQYPDPLYPTTHDQQCENAITVVRGVGASFQRTAQLAWGTRIIAPDPANPLAQGFGYDTVAPCNQFKLAADGGTKRVEYAPSGSGAGRAAFGATDAAGSARNLTIDFGGTDDAPTPTQVANANEGPNVVAGADSDDGVLHTIPIAQGSVAVDARIPDGCELTVAGRQLARNRIEGFYRGLAAFDTWKELVGTNIVGSAGGLSSAVCQAKKPARVVRFDNSGTTNIFKRYLQKAAAGAFDWREPADGGTLANNAWPSATINAGVNGNGPELDTVAAQGTNGGIGYGDLGGSRGRNFGWSFSGGVAVQSDRTIWLRIQRIANTSYISPATNNDQVGTKGAACTHVTYTNQGATTKSSWQDTAAVETTTDYPICGLTYALAWQSPKAVGITSTARAVGRRDYLGYILDRPGLGTTPTPAGCVAPNSSYGKGQCKLPAADYALLPADVFAKSRAGMVQLDN
jgi:ABC-type phosphate transport system substrate-binding protein